MEMEKAKKIVLIMIFVLLIYFAFYCMYASIQNHSINEEILSLKNKIDVNRNNCR